MCNALSFAGVGAFVGIRLTDGVRPLPSLKSGSIDEQLKRLNAKQEVDATDLSG